jgi:outer membrane protein
MRPAAPFRCLAVLIVAGLGGCQTPFDDESRGGGIERSVSQAIERELAGLADQQEPITHVQAPSDVEIALDKWKDRLDQMGPQVRGTAPKSDLGPDLTGAGQTTVSIALADVVNSAVRNNLSTRIARLQPGVTAEDVIAAEAVFDAVLFTDVDFAKIDEPSTVPVLNGIPLGSSVTANESWRFRTGLNKRFATGGEVGVSTGLQRYNDQTPNFTFLPDPAYTTDVTLGFTQPLLRGFGEAVNTAEIRFAQNAQKRAADSLERNMLQLVFDTEAAYWDLVFAWQDLAIREWLTQVGIEVRTTLGKRRDFDTKLAEYSDAVARVETRRADVIRARRVVRAASDRLKRLMNDQAISIPGEAVLLPIDAGPQSPITSSLSDAVRTGIANRPEVREALWRIDDAALRQVLADNARLPSLGLRGQMVFTGLDADADDAYGNLGDDFIDYAAGVAFELPLGNRAAEAAFRRARLERSGAVLAYRQAVQDVIVGVKSALRDVLTAFELLQATRSARVAQAENLRTLQVTEQTLAALTPEFLNLKFQRQDALAEAQRQEVLAISTYSRAVAQLHHAMGTGLQRQGIAVDPERLEP